MIKKIPVFGTQTLNSFSNLKKLLKSIDYPIETLSIVVNNENVNYFLEIRKFCEDNLDKNLIERVDVSFHPTNLGCPASWNYHFKSYPYADFFIKSDDDIEFSPGDLEQMVRVLEKSDMVFYNSSNTKYALFGINKETLKTIGLFDENLYPCNYEDNDYELRLEKNDNLVCAHFEGLGVFHISSGTSSNITQEEHIQYLGKYITTTKEYFEKKWEGKFGDPMRWDYNFDYRENKIFRYSKYY